MTLKNFRMRWDPSIRSDVSQSQWEGGVISAFRDLYIRPCETSRAVIDGIQRTSCMVTIVPEPPPSQSDKSASNAHADPIDSLKATIPGGKPERPPSPGDRGSGGGSDVILQFTPQDGDPSSSDSLDAVDEILLHELVHALRQTMGIEDSEDLRAGCSPGDSPDDCRDKPFSVLRRGDGNLSSLMAQNLFPELGLNKSVGKTGIHSQIYNNNEEFVAIMVTNIYRSEVGRPGLRRDHLAGNAVLAYPLTNPRNFLTVWRPLIQRICSEMPAVCDRLAVVNCHFNPIFELYAAQNRFIPGKRRVRA